MAVTLAELEAYHAELLEQMYSGALSVMHQGKQVTFRSTKQMQAAVADLERRMARLRGDTPRKSITVTTSKGL